MENTRKMILIPQTGSGEDINVDRGVRNIATQTTPFSRGRVSKVPLTSGEKQKKLLSIVLKLALAGGYDEHGYMKLPDGSFKEFEIIPLILYACTPTKTQAGIENFVKLLHQAGVLPEDIINPSVRELLIKIGREVGGNHHHKPPSPPTAPLGNSDHTDVMDKSTDTTDLIEEQEVGGKEDGEEVEEDEGDKADEGRPETIQHKPDLKMKLLKVDPSGDQWMVEKNNSQVNKGEKRKRDEKDDGKVEEKRTKLRDIWDPDDSDLDE